MIEVRASMVLAMVVSAVAIASAQPSPQPQPQPTPPPPRPAEPRGDVLPPSPPPPSPPQQIACDACVRGEQLLRDMGSYGNNLRMHARYIAQHFVEAAVATDAPNQEQVNRITDVVTAWNYELRETLLQLDGKTDDQLVDIGAALCNSPDPECAKYVGAGLKQARELARTLNPDDESRRPYGLPEPPQTCDPYVVHIRSPKMGFGVEYGEGWQASRNPVDGRAWSLGIEARSRFSNKLGMVARIDRSTGRDEAADSDGDGHDDTQTGAVVRWTALVGPSVRLTTIRHEDMARYWQVDSLVGFSRDASRSGPIVGLDLSYQFLPMRVGLRMTQGFADAGEERAIIVHSGIMVGAGPQFDVGAGCDFVERNERGSAWAIGLDIPLVGYGQHEGAIVPGFGLEAALHLHPMFDFLVHGDIVVMPRGDEERALHQTVLAGGRIDFSHHPQTGDVKGVFATLGAGYDLVAAPSSAAVQSGPIVEGSVAWGMQGSDGAAWLRLHGRFGVGPDNADLRAVFLSLGMEIRLDRQRWRDRN